MSDAPNRAAGPNAAQLRADIDSGRTGDKIGASDPAMAPLGTDDEAAGTAPSPQAVAAARASERASPTVKAEEVGRDSEKPRGLAISLLIALVVVIAAVVVWRLYAR